MITMTNKKGDPDWDGRGALKDHHLGVNLKVPNLRSISFSAETHCVLPEHKIPLYDLPTENLRRAITICVSQPASTCLDSSSVGQPSFP